MAVCGQKPINHSTRGSKFHHVAFHLRTLGKFAQGRAFLCTCFNVFLLPIIPATLIVVWYWVGNGIFNECNSRRGKPLTPFRVFLNNRRLVPWRSINMLIALGARHCHLHLQGLQPLAVVRYLVL